MYASLKVEECVIVHVHSRDISSTIPDGIYCYWNIQEIDDVLCYNSNQFACHGTMDTRFFGALNVDTLRDPPRL